MKKIAAALLCSALLLTSCSIRPPRPTESNAGAHATETQAPSVSPVTPTYRDDEALPSIQAGETSVGKREYVDENGDAAVIPDGFTVSSEKGEQTIATGLVVIGPDGNEFVWVPVTETAFTSRDFGSYFGGTPFSSYWDDTDSEEYQAMEASVNRYGGFYMGRYEASKGGGSDLSDYVPASKRISKSGEGKIWVQFSPQDTAIACRNLYADNPTVAGFFPYGANYDTTLAWLVDSGAKTLDEVAGDSTEWGNYTDDEFSPNANGVYTGRWEETKANNIYDLAGNNWEWTQERCGSSNYVMRGGGYSLMGGPCSGSRYPAALRDPLPGNNHHPNVTFRVGLYLK